MISETLVYPNTINKINKYKSFVRYDFAKYKQRASRTMLTIVVTCPSRLKYNSNELDTSARNAIFDDYTPDILFAY